MKAQRSKLKGERGRAEDGGRTADDGGRRTEDGGQMIHHRDTPVKHKNNGFTGRQRARRKKKKTLCLRGIIFADGGQKADE